ncbi:uncharacterized protein LOC107041853 isoform X2 [Diachasma alloeum]|uniref:uncharacterized protein LOC107041853 isoform X2 n=1 Tax=Diachasma alloeum TaxID=454923 RepID=UPI0007382672|nr:uncharacterized protein LOC107041853 isoform X2 [Diachasma alloeum]
MEKSFDELMDSDLELNESVFDYPEEVLQSREDVIESDNNELDDETWTSQTQPTLGSSANSNESAIDEDLNDNTRKATDHHNMVPSHIREAAEKARSNLLPKKSNSSYMFAYHKFKTWLVKNELNVDSIDRDIMLAYFNKLKEKYKPSSLWATYSKLRSTISTYHNINIHNFSQLIQFLKNANKVYRSVQALALTEEQVRTCLLTAPDQIYLDVKVVWILGMYGACHRCELKNLKITDFKEKGDDLEFFLDETKTDNPRSYVVPQPLCTKENALDNLLA